MTITEECFQRGIQRRDIYTKIPVILPGTKAALVLRPEVEPRRRRAKIYLAARFRFRRNEKKGEKNKREDGRTSYIFYEKGNARKTHGNEVKRALSLYLLVACFMRNSHESSSSMKRPCEVHRVRARYASTHVCIRETRTSVRDEAWHTHVRDECVLEMKRELYFAWELLE